ncbi:hypothetical protein [Chromobacterium vaccinii]|uniref:hypothetical protein n=1 Tax=Chromobacterium vaccinii TaxID=1108595 RepID=UPI000E1B08CF|nr:hypothetical protein [Chromobacterium vaccinii]SUX30691.1 Uncharacterised protein [Chromobacterium vaccinii]
MNAAAFEVQTNLYTRLMDAALGRYRTELDAVNVQRRNIERAERMSRRLRDIEMNASAEIQDGAGFIPFVVLRLPIELMRFQHYAMALAGGALERRLVPNGRDAQGRDRFQILAAEGEGINLELVVEAI